MGEKGTMSAIKNSSPLPEYVIKDDGTSSLNVTSLEDIRPIAGTDNHMVTAKRIKETAMSFEVEGAMAMNQAIASLAEIAPRDGIEGMLASQMIATHEMSMIMARRSVASKTIDTIESAVNLTAKLNRSFTAQMDALQRYRTKGQQKIVVEHQQVTVESGGQAVIGDVHHGGGGKKEK